MATDDTYQQQIIEDPETTAILAQAGVYFASGLYRKAEPLFRQIPKSYPKYPVAATGLFNVLWARGTPEAQREAMQIIEDFLAEADREDPQARPVLANFIKIKIDLLRKGVWTL